MKVPLVEKSIKQICALAALSRTVGMLSNLEGTWMFFFLNPMPEQCPFKH